MHEICILFTWYSKFDGIISVYSKSSSCPTKSTMSSTSLRILFYPRYCYTVSSVRFLLSPVVWFSHLLFFLRLTYQLLQKWKTKYSSSVFGSAQNIKTIKWDKFFETVLLFWTMKRYPECIIYKLYHYAKEWHKRRSLKVKRW